MIRSSILKTEGQFLKGKYLVDHDYYSHYSIDFILQSKISTKVKFLHKNSSRVRVGGKKGNKFPDET